MTTHEKIEPSMESVAQGGTVARPEPDRHTIDHHVAVAAAEADSADLSGFVVPPPPRSRRGAVVAAALAAVMIILFAVGAVPRMHSASSTAAMAKESPALNVIVIEAKKAKAALELSLPATMQPEQETPIYARTNGYVKRWTVDIGARVAAGQLLAEIETPELDRELKQAAANVQQARANLALAKTTADRWKAVLKDNAVAPQEVDEKIGAYEARKADVAAAEANRQRLHELKSFERVVAPFAGIVTGRNVDVGHLISAGNTDPSRWMFKVAKVDTLRAYINVPQANMRSVAPGTPATIVLREYGGQTYPGKVVRTAGALDAQSKTLLTEVQVPNEKGELIAGMYAQVKFTLNQGSPAIMVPSNTLIVRADGPQVAVVENSQVKMHKVGLGRDFGTQLEVLSGLDENSLVITNPSDSVHDGVTVKTTLAVPEKPAGAPPAAPAKPADKPQGANDKPADKPAAK